MRADELREAYLSFFEGKGHTRYPSDSLVPANDPTLLFTGAGMNQFKEMFLGVGNLPFKRATTSQKCFRTGDLDNVGKTYYHHTFFEMLGNFSFGDYFKREAIHWAWELVTKVLKLPSDKIWVSVYQDDDEAFDIWTKEVGFRRDRVWRLGPKSNFWPANAPEDGPNGPCGPCSEIFWDFGSPGAEGDPDAARYCEFWNLVFQQYNRVGKNDLVPLKQAGVDTGMGFERMLAVMNGVRSNFETDLFRPIIDEVARIARREYAFEDPLGPQFRRIADHVRAGVFLVADGVKPSNEGRGYVARRVLRRAVRDGIALGIEKPFLHRLVPTIVGLMGRAYPEVKSAEAAATAFLRAEDEKFRETYFTGIELLERELRGLRGKTLPGETAFVLYDSHGFPFELCEEICAEKGIRVDRAAFEREMEKQRARSREGSAMGGEVFVATALSALKKDARETEFLGYAREEAESLAEAVIRGETPVDEITAKDGDTRILARATPFYSESGGQVGDAGEITGPRGKFLVADTKRIEGYVFHYGRVVEGAIRKGERIELRIDRRRRSEIRRNHSATHLLHAALRLVLGKHVTQAGSLVAPDRLRFDFTHPKPVTAEELSAIEEWVQEEILRNSEVTTEVMDTHQAKAMGAMALFGEKYGDVVRVVRIGPHSLELCGGTHVGSSAEIGTSLVTSEGGVAAGVRRIEMISGGGAFTLARAQRGMLRELATSLRTEPGALDQRVAALQREVRDLRKREADQARSVGLAAVDDLLRGAAAAKGVTVVAGVVEGDDAGALRALADALRAKAGESVLLLAGRGKERAALLVTASDGAVKRGVKAGDVLKGLADRLGGKGGGKPQMAQGQAPLGEGLEDALLSARDAVSARLQAT
jgi:alanyl-tRNA synthetase